MKKLVLLLILILGFGGVVSAQSTTYVVKRGDTLSQIARAHGTTVHSIVNANNIVNANRIYAGMVLHIPTSYRTYVIRYGDTLSQIALRYGTTVEAIRALNNLQPWTINYPGDVILIPPPSYHQPHYPPYQPPVHHNFYTVRRGDTMLRIAARFGVNVWDLAAANGIYNLNRIYVGQRLVIP